MSVVKTAQEPGLPYAVKGTFWCESMLSMSGKSKKEIWLNRKLVLLVMMKCILELSNVQDTY